MINVFRRLGSETELSEDIIAKVEEYIALMYGKKKVASLNEARLEIFLEKYKHSGNEGRLGAVKKLDGSSLPPCHAVLLQKLRRTCLVANMWMSSSTPHPVPLNPTDYGWKHNDCGMYDLNWFQGDVYPKSLDVVCKEVNN